MQFCSLLYWTHFMNQYELVLDCLGDKIFVLLYRDASDAALPDFMGIYEVSWRCVKRIVKLFGLYILRTVIVSVHEFTTPPNVFDYIPGNFPTDSREFAGLVASDSLYAMQKNARCWDTNFVRQRTSNSCILDGLQFWIDIANICWYLALRRYIFYHWRRKFDSRL